MKFSNIIGLILLLSANQVYAADSDDVELVVEEVNTRLITERLSESEKVNIIAEGLHQFSRLDDRIEYMKVILGGIKDFDLSEESNAKLVLQGAEILKDIDYKKSIGGFWPNYNELARLIFDLSLCAPTGVDLNAQKNILETILGSKGVNEQMLQEVSRSLSLCHLDKKKSTNFSWAMDQVLKSIRFNTSVAERVLYYLTDSQPISLNIRSSDRPDKRISGNELAVVFEGLVNSGKLSGAPLLGAKQFLKSAKIRGQLETLIDSGEELRGQVNAILDIISQPNLAAASTDAVISWIKELNISSKVFEPIINNLVKQLDQTDVKELDMVVDGLAGARMDLKTLAFDQELSISTQNTIFTFLRDSTKDQLRRNQSLRFLILNDLAYKNVKFPMTIAQKVIEDFIKTTPKSLPADPLREGAPDFDDGVKLVISAMNRCKFSNGDGNPEDTFCTYVKNRSGICQLIIANKNLNAETHEMAKKVLAGKNIYED